jgi:hypothetical protein
MDGYLSEHAEMMMARLGSFDFLSRFLSNFNEKSSAEKQEK